MKTPFTHKIYAVILFGLNLVDILLIMNNRQYEMNTIAISIWNSIGFLPASLLKLGLVGVIYLVSYIACKKTQPHEERRVSIILYLSFGIAIWFYSVVLGWNLAIRNMVFS